SLSRRIRLSRSSRSRKPKLGSPTLISQLDLPCSLLEGGIAISRPQDVLYQLLRDFCVLTVEYELLLGDPQGSRHAGPGGCLHELSPQAWWQGRIIIDLVQLWADRIDRSIQVKSGLHSKGSQGTPGTDGRDS